MLYLIDNKNNNDPAVNLAIEEYAVRNLETEDKNHLFLYINEPSVIIGKHQNTLEEVNIEFAKKNNIKIVRRISGGGAVYHDFGNLNYCIITKSSPSFINNYKMFLEPVIYALASLGLKPKIESGSKIEINGKKISGNSQFNNTKSLLTHGTLLFNSNLYNLKNVLQSDIEITKSKSIKSKRSEVTNISDYLNPKISINKFKNEILASYKNNYKDVRKYEFNIFEWQQINEIAEQKYRNREWNFDRSPEFEIFKKGTLGQQNIEARILIKEGIIRNMNIYAETLEKEKLNQLKELLTGKPYDKEKILDIIKNIDISPKIRNIDTIDFIKFLY